MSPDLLWTLYVVTSVILNPWHQASLTLTCALCTPGLARTCEIFGVSELVLSNVKILEEKQFQSLSVTAEKWLTITEVCKYMLCVLSIMIFLIVAIDSV